MIVRTSGPNLQFELNTKRFEEQRKKAQKKLNILVLADSTPYVPFQQGQLRSQTRFPDGIYGETLEWYAPYAHYQYMGELYLAQDGSSYAKKYEVKHPAGRPLNYHDPNTGHQWFERAKQTHELEWIKQIRRIGGGG